MIELSLFTASIVCALACAVFLALVVGVALLDYPNWKHEPNRYFDLTALVLVGIAICVAILIFGGVIIIRL